MGYLLLKDGTDQVVIFLVFFSLPAFLSWSQPTHVSTTNLACLTSESSRRAGETEGRTIFHSPYFQPFINKNDVDTYSATL